MENTTVAARASLKRRSEKKWTYVNKWFIAVPLLFLTLFFLIPLVKLLYMSLFESDTSGSAGELSLASYARFLTDPFYLKILGQTLGLGLVSTLICIVMGYPVAYKIARMTGKARSFATACVVFPLWVSITIRIFGWLTILQPLSLVGNYAGVLIGLVHVGLPFMIMTLISPIENVDRSLEDASYVFGAGFLGTFFKVVFPLTLPGVVSGALLVFSLNTAAFIVPMMLGSGKILVMTTLIYQQALFVYDWSFAAAIAVILLAASLLIVVGVRKYSKDTKLTQ
ncbi:ABC transporter permease [Paenibacillus sp. TH7-28]